VLRGLGERAADGPCRWPGWLRTRGISGAAREWGGFRGLVSGAGFDLWPVPRTARALSGLHAAAVPGMGRRAWRTFRNRNGLGPTSSVRC
jgi:hypothetical protein